MSICCALASTNVVAYGISGFLPYPQAVAILIPVAFGILYFIDRKTANTLELDNDIKILMDTVDHQTEILDEYERIFDSQLVELPCVCGGNTFQGLFSPKTENIVTCDKCKNNYRVDIHYESVLISEPMNVEKTFEELVSESN